jgi:hypothetical protein
VFCFIVSRSNQVSSSFVPVPSTTSVSGSTCPCASSPCYVSPAVSHTCSSIHAGVSFTFVSQTSWLVSKSRSDVTVRRTSGNVVLCMTLPSPFLPLVSVSIRAVEAELRYQFLGGYALYLLGFRNFIRANSYEFCRRGSSIWSHSF